jgi:hypothetical protein
MSVVQGKLLFQNGEFVGLAAMDINIPGERLTNNTPRKGWLTKVVPCCGEGDTTYQLHLEDPKDAGAISGVWVEFDGQGVLIDGTLADAIAKINDCCGEDKTIVPVYNGVFPADPAQQLVEYTLDRIDDGTLRAEQKMRLDYFNEYKEGTFFKTAHDANTGHTTYKFSAYKDPVPQGTDTVTGEVARVFDSNIPGALADGTDQYKLTANFDGVDVEYTGAAGQTLTQFAAALEADGVLTLWGAWTQNGGALRLTTTTVTNANMIVSKIVNP